MDIMYLYGTPNDGSGRIKVTADGQANIQFTGAANISPFMQNIKAKHHNFCLSGPGKSQPYQFNFWPNVIVNQISDPDTHGRSLNKAVVFCGMQKCPVINSPEQIKLTSRDQIYALLKDTEGLIIPKTIRIKPTSPKQIQDAITEQGLKYPVIFRKAGDHGGVSTSLIASKKTVAEATYAYALDGSDYYVTQYVDYPSADGTYHKCRLVIVGDELFVRHRLVSPGWMVHAVARDFMKENPQYIVEEQEFIRAFDTQYKPKLLAVVDRIKNKLNLDYFGIDCHIQADGSLLIFEVNANMNILVSPFKIENVPVQPEELMKEALRQLILKKASNHAPVI